MCALASQPIKRINGRKRPIKWIKKMKWIKPPSLRAQPEARHCEERSPRHCEGAARSNPCERCEKTAGLLRHFVPRNDVQRASLRLQACEAGSPRHCEGAARSNPGKWHEKTIGLLRHSVPRNDVQRASLRLRACEAGSPSLRGAQPSSLRGRSPKQSMRAVRKNCWIASALRASQ